MNVLYLTQRVPFPPNRGDKIASYHAIRHLSRKHSVFVAALAESEEELEHSSELSRLFVVDAALRTPAAARVSVLMALVTGEPLSVAYYRSRALAKKVARRVEQIPFDAVIAFSSSMGQYADLVPGVPLIADFVDMDSRKWELYAKASRWPRSAVYALEERRLLEYERKLAGRAACTLVRTEAEREDCRRLIPGRRFEVLSNGVDLELFKADGPKPGSHDIVFTGVMDYFPNVQGALYFADKVLPLVRSQVPDATFTIVGARPVRAVLALGRRPGIIVTGQVPDVRPYLRRAAVAVAPLLLARGIQNKVLEAMAMETPVVTTRAAFRGVDAQVGEGVLPADGLLEFAQKVVAFLRDPAFAAEVGKRGRRLVERRYVWEEQLERLEAILAEVAAPPRKPSREHLTKTGRG
ncbi:MAG: TIGR03087 family PEP-CTERM/XrtA system glycosyltransferase [Planctomycetes bacterium]|nr:TIGR03087 family PEP-CTERM/XrtA system glycosyltransferase [Planctomycetota bacterium]